MALDPADAEKLRAAARERFRKQGLPVPSRSQMPTERQDDVRKKVQDWRHLWWLALQKGEEICLKKQN